MEPSAALIAITSDKGLILAAYPPSVASLLGVSVHHLANQRAKGTGPTYLKVGRRVAYPVDDLRAWIFAQIESDQS